MSRPIAYNKPGAAINGSITNEDAVISYVVDGRGNDYYNDYESCKWVPSADGAAPIVFVTDTFTRGYEGDPNLAVPLFFACAGTSSAAILYTANRLPGSPGNYTNANTAIDELNRTYGYFILESNDPFQGINATSLVLDLDASKMTSYPQTANNWYDLSGEGNTGALTNGPTWISSSGSFSFDGVDDYVEISNNNGFGTAGIAPVATLGFTANLQRKSGGGTQFQQVAGFRNGGTYEFFFLLLDGSGATVDTEARLRTSGGIYDINVPFTSYFDKWTRVDFVANSNRTDLYFNGNLVGSNTSVSGIFQSTSGPFRIGLSPAGSFPSKGLIQDTSFYSRALSQTEIKQNYFGSPIVTNGLVFAVDANNIVSYPKSGTSAYNLTGSNVATLVNGLTYQLGNGGYFLSDGTDDGLTTPDASNLDLSTFTLEGWVWWNRHKDYGSLFVKGPGGSGNVFNYCFFFYAGNIVCGFGDGNAFYSVSISTPTTNTWHHIVGTYDGSTLKFYLDGVLIATQGVVAAPYQNTTTLNIIQPDYPIDGRVANGRIYNRALTAAEIQQNYQSEQYRFETPAGIPTNGLILHLDAANKQSYPGSGTVWYDISGQGANADLVNGVAYNSAGYFFFDGTDDIANSINISQDYRDLVIGIWSESNGGLEMVFSLYGGSDASFRLNNNIMFSANNNDDWQFGSNSLVFVDGVYTPDSNLASQFHFVRTYRSNNVDFGTSFRYSLSSTFLSRYFKGKIAFVLCYNRQLSDSEVRALYYYYKDRFGF